MNRSLLISIALVGFVLAPSAHASWWKHADGQNGQESCPTDERYHPECLASAIPPYPICLKNDMTAQQWVEHALDSATRCCNEHGDSSDCRCPVKNDDNFLHKIEGKCAGIAMCRCASPSCEEGMPSVEKVDQEASVMEKRRDEVTEEGTRGLRAVMVP
uniref:Uncharacterized protein n=1 Tax=Odontella aurita TaxID=265563 RepID=A0A7S4MX23_9STRA|mmetsp:Transcript_37809/g.113066  ORF Transcript_37809/g.113066 Transcript_37809/m.113066 type:complete len:159 (+) Transcript_37809:65-541(+)|eukprot:CAMPEP_0113560612 /NCGR_PEP_ID=MMETSP0015_2-20120614/19525_1 /TAXON_ID=2838 /ORGANISM="Odontella" /LENGTH=158 /DNA_ID=CAMNT_0000462331 /DNA_START=23 /DNA_END=499 /DNA_ORIENTATION=+ /assembly_acc=CAM_ASM_000160